MSTKKKDPIPESSIGSLLLRCCCDLSRCCAAAVVVGPTGIEPVCIAARDFKSLVSTYFTTVPRCCCTLLCMACPERFELPTHSLEGCCSIQLSYGQIWWWAPRESNSAPTDYESAALTNMS